MKNERRKNPPSAEEIKAAEYKAEHSRRLMAAHGRLLDLRAELHANGTDYDKYLEIMDKIRDAEIEYAAILQEGQS